MTVFLDKNDLNRSGEALYSEGHMGRLSFEHFSYPVNLFHLAHKIVFIDGGNSKVLKSRRGETG